MQDERWTLRISWSSSQHCENSHLCEGSYEGYPYARSLQVIEKSIDGNNVAVASMCKPMPATTSNC